MSKRARMRSVCKGGGGEGDEGEAGGEWRWVRVRVWVRASESARMSE